MSAQLGSEEVAAGALGCVGPIKVAFSPDGKKLTYLFPDQSGQRQIFSISTNADDLPTHSARIGGSRLFESTDGSAGKISLEEQLRRERMRLFTLGISHYEWSQKLVHDTAQMLVPVGDKLYVFNDSASASYEEKYQIIYESELGAAIDPHLSPDGDKVAFVVNNDLYFKPASATEKPVRLTHQGEQNGISCAVADYVAQEEMSRYEGFWWSPNGQQILFTINDESFIPEYQILHQGKENPQHHETHRYPFAGKQNPYVRLQVLTLPASADEVPATIELSLIDAEDNRFSSPTPAPGQTQEYYVARAGWWPDHHAMVQVTNREQTFLQLLHIDAQTGKRVVLLEESSAVWVNLHELLRVLPDDYRHPSDTSFREGDFYFLWGSERSGFMQIYLYKYDSLQQRGVLLLEGAPLGGQSENWVVESINDVDLKRQVVYLTGNWSNLSERHLVRVDLNPTAGDASSVVLVTQTAGWHDAVVHAELGLVAEVFSSKERPVAFYLHRLDASTGTTVTETYTIFDALEDDARVQRQLPVLHALIPPTIHVIRSGAPDPAVDLFCAVYLPPGLNLQDYLLQQQQPTAQKLASFPAIMSVYGGPHVMRVQNQWILTADLRAQRLAQLGIVVIKVDNRGSYRRGLTFEGAIKHDMGNVEVLDQVTAVDYFANLGLVDRARVGMFGWSYGGYMSAMSLCRAPDVFNCAVAGAPVTSWDGYDTHYTERYMGHPELNVKGYADSSVMNHVSKMTGHLLLVHGLIDENVHFRHTARLINELIAARKRYELIMFPCERHSPHKMQDKIYLEDIMTEFFLKHLTPVPMKEVFLALASGGNISGANAASAQKKASL